MKQCKVTPRKNISYIVETLSFVNEPVGNAFESFLWLFKTSSLKLALDRPC